MPGGAAHTYGIAFTGRFAGRPVRRGEDTDRVVAAQDSRVDSLHVGVVHEGSGEPERRTPDHLAQRADTDVARRPLHDPQRRPTQLASPRTGAASGSGALIR